MQAKKTRVNKTGIIILRVEPELKAKYRMAAADKGLTLTELILLSVDGVQIDYRYDKAFKTELLLLKKEMNAIGKNINQVTHVIHILKNQGNLYDRELKVFNELLAGYSERINKINEQFRVLLNF
jgi:hypothetical protein